MKNWSHYVDNEPLILQYHLSSIFKYYFRLHRVSHIMKRGAEIGAEIALKTKFIQRSPRDLLSSAHCIILYICGCSQPAADPHKGGVFAI